MVKWKITANLIRDFSKAIKMGYKVGKYLEDLQYNLKEKKKL